MPSTSKWRQVESHIDKTNLRADPTHAPTHIRVHAHTLPRKEYANTYSSHLINKMSSLIEITQDVSLCVRVGDISLTRPGTEVELGCQSHIKANILLLVKRESSLYTAEADGLTTPVSAENERRVKGGGGFQLCTAAVGALAKML